MTDFFHVARCEKPKKTGRNFPTKHAERYKFMIFPRIAEESFYLIFCYHSEITFKYFSATSGCSVTSLQRPVPTKSFKNKISLPFALRVDNKT